MNVAGRFVRKIIHVDFGRFGQRLNELAFGIDDSPVVPDRPTKYPSRVLSNVMCC